ncbi:MAG TPA: right-handed parallel beta-helix repeat-containing protein [Vicinamibacterales bacterium]|nr:right-handed parallel beta-helix repeat-containing protein [Vicinamibacterales bacterium]
MDFRTGIGFALAVSLLSPAAVSAADFYVSAAGSDANAGTAASPWQTLARVNALALQPGDRVLLRGGDTFAGRLQLDAQDAGTPQAPVTITSYGTGRATIRPASGAGINAYNTSGIRIANVNVAGDGGNTSGIVFYTDLSGGVKLPFVRIESVEVTGFGRDGIEIGSWNGTTGFRDVRITRAWTHRNVRTGILVYAQRPLAHEDVYVGYSRAFDNPGNPASTVNSGSGIVLGGVHRGTVEWSVAAGNGAQNTAVGGPVGIWTYDSSRILIQHNQSYANRTSSRADGGGFDFDQNVSDSILQYNYSHDNDGAGYLLAHRPDTAAHRGNIVRFNLSENDGRRNSYAGIELWGRIEGTRIHHNTVRVSPAASGRPSAVRVWNGGVEDRRVTGVLFHDNVLVTTGGLPVVDVSPTQSSPVDLRFEQNLYHAADGSFAIVWNGGTYGSLAAWRSTGQEVRDGAATGVQAAPGAATPPAEIVLNAATAATLAGGWRRAADPTAAPGWRLWHPDAGGAKIVSPFAAPAHYFELTFDARAGRPYRLWMRLKADGNHWANDSVFAQFSGAVDARGAPAWRIGSTTALEVNLEECGGCGVAEWGWQDTGYGSGVLGPTVYFAADGPQTIRVQTREDGVSVDQVLLSSELFAAAAPGSAKLDATPLPLQAPLASAVTPPPAAAGIDEIVIRASDVPAAALAGDWYRVSDPTAADGLALWNPNRGAPKGDVLAQPVSYFDVTFRADGGVDYHVWIRLRADDDSYLNDSVTVQFSDALDASGAPYARIGTRNGGTIVLQDSTGAPISGWGWNDTGWASMAAPIRFERSGEQTLRIQQREDGLRIDQIVISAKRYRGLSPGSLTRDATIVPRPPG